MGKYIFRRVLLLIPTLIIVCIIVFALMRIVPGDAVDMIVYRMVGAGQNVDADAVRAMLGMDVPAARQLINWFGGVLRGDLGDSLFQYESVCGIISKKLPISLELGLMSLILASVISIPLGVFCAARQDGVGDYIIRTVAVFLMAVPTFWLATLVLIYPSLWWGYAPPSQYVGLLTDPIQNLRMFLLPAVLGALQQAGSQLRMVRTTTLEVMRTDYIRTAWAKGLGEQRILFRHAFRNSMIPVITMVGGSVAAMIGGTVILENLFNIPGIGQTLITALNYRDYPLIQGCVLIMSLFVMVINLVVDVAYKWCDPRVTLD